MRFAIISDTHLCPPATKDGPWQSMMFLSRSYDLVRQLCAKLAALQVDALLHCGDFTNFATAEDFDAGAALFDALGCPWYFVRGNHDLSPAIAARMAQRYGGTNYAVTFGDRMRLLCLDAGEQTLIDGKVYYRATEEMLQFLRAQRALPFAGKTVVLSHMPFITTLCPDFPARIQGVAEPDTLYDALQGWVDGAIFGHWHTNGISRKGDMWALHTGATCEAPFGFYIVDTEEQTLRQYRLQGPEEST